MNYPSNAMINNQEKDRINYNNKFHGIHNVYYFISFLYIYIFLIKNH